MGILITVDSLSRRVELDVVPRPLHFKPWRMNGKNKWNDTALLNKAAEAFKVREGITRRKAYFKLADEPRLMTYGNQRVLVAYGSVLVSGTGRYAMARDISGIVEVRISGLEGDNYECIS